MRSITKTIAQIQALLPTPDVTPAVVADQITTLRAELNIMYRSSMYVAPEGAQAAWVSLSATLYRYLPQPGSYPWVKAIADLMATGV